MKSFIKITATLLFLAAINKINAQFCAEPSVIKPQSPVSGGAGFAFNLLSPAINKYDIKNPNHLEVRIGAGVYTSKLNEFSVSDVPLDAPLTGNSRVRFKNKTYGYDLISRFSLPYSKMLVPYMDVFAGLKNYSCNMFIYPDNSQCYPQSSQNLSQISEFNYGLSGGILLSLSKHLKLDLGFTQSWSKFQGDMINVESAHLESGSLVVNNMALPTKMLMLKAGLVFHFKNLKEIKESLAVDETEDNYAPVTAPAAVPVTGVSNSTVRYNTPSYSGNSSASSNNYNGRSGSSSYNGYNNYNSGNSGNYTPVVHQPAYTYHPSTTSPSSGGCTSCGSTPHVSVHVRPGR